MLVTWLRTFFERFWSGSDFSNHTSAMASSDLASRSMDWRGRISPALPPA
jgi:hypothetical protein